MTNVLRQKAFINSEEKNDDSLNNFRQNYKNQKRKMIVKHRYFLRMQFLN